MTRTAPVVLPVLLSPNTGEKTPDESTSDLLKPLVGSRSTFLHPFPAKGVIDRARLQSLVEQAWRLNRTAVNPDTDLFVNMLTKELHADVIEVQAGAECLTWQIPMHWSVRKGQLRRGDGTILVDFADNPLHLWTHSVSFSGRISREDLFANHVQTDQSRPDEIIYHFRNGYRFGVREWGFSLPYRTVKEMHDESYVVEIDSDLDLNGSLRVVDAFLPGELPDTIFIMAHTCHPALVADGIGSVAVAAEIYHMLSRMPSRRYSYRFLFGPEYFGAAAYLARAPQQAIKALHFGIFLDSLTNHEQLGFQHSMQGNSRLDHIAHNVLASHVPILLEMPYRKLWGNDETFYNGPGFMIPTIGVARAMYREYHYDTDNLDNLSLYKADESAWTLHRILTVFETDYIPSLTFSGPLYLSRYGLYIDPTIDPDGAGNLERVLALIDGERSCMDIAIWMGMDFFFVRDLFDSLESKGLSKRRPRPPRQSDAGTFA
jgi:aminopeptidase-like protein